MSLVKIVHYFKGAEKFAEVTCTCSPHNFLKYYNLVCCFHLFLPLRTEPHAPGGVPGAGGAGPPLPHPPRLLMTL